MGAVVRRVSGPELLSRAEAVRRVYTDAFGSGNRSQDRDAAVRYLGRLASDAVRPGFVGALADDGGRIVGFATGWTTPAVLPPDRCYPQVAAGLGTERTRAWLCGGREVDELAVAGAVRGQRVGAALLGAVTADAAEDRCWLITSIRAREALAFYRHMGWVQATHPAPEGDGYAALLGPRHPARTAVPLPL
ncbi:GNAT family N-acetyltransferase [Streptomyces sp. NPDC012473]|uniref:GNAT family N-acetyltransferase n=1 Tax=Streptomyces sp. NPDC012473 TaxID=3156676 RepID=UPI0033DABC05